MRTIPGPDRMEALQQPRGRCLAPNARPPNARPPTPVGPTPIHATPARPTPVPPTPVRPTPVRPTPIHATPARQRPPANARPPTPVRQRPFPQRPPVQRPSPQRPPYTRHGPARPDHRPPHTRSHRCGFRSHRCGFGDRSVDPSIRSSRPMTVAPKVPFHPRRYVGAYDDKPWITMISRGSPRWRMPCLRVRPEPNQRVAVHLDPQAWAGRHRYVTIHRDEGLRQQRGAHRMLGAVELQHRFDGVQ